MEILEFVIIALLVLIVLGFVTLYFAYFKKKGEYQAIKEEIERVTRTTEGIKRDLDLITVSTRPSALETSLGQ